LQDIGKNAPGWLKNIRMKLGRSACRNLLFSDLRAPKGAQAPRAFLPILRENGGFGGLT